MRVNYVLLAAAVVLVGAIDSSVATADTVAKLGMESPAFAVESDNHRSLRLVKDDVIDSEEDESDDDDDDDDDDEENASDDDSVQEERGWLSDKLALAGVASKFAGKSSDEIGDMLRKLDPEDINTIFTKGERSIKKILPGFRSNMDGAEFGNLIRNLPMDVQAPLLSGYSKYLHINGLL